MFCCASLVPGNFYFVLLFGSALHNILQQAVFTHFLPEDLPLDSGPREKEQLCFQPELKSQLSVGSKVMWPGC